MLRSEFEQFVQKEQLDLVQMHFAVGVLKYEPKWFGIYQDGDEWVCYKNKANGQHVEHYRGSEDAAFQIFYDKLVSEKTLRHLAEETQQAREAAQNGALRESSGDDGEVHDAAASSGVDGEHCSGNVFKRAFILLAVVFCIFGLSFSSCVRNLFHSQNDHRNGYYGVGSNLFYADAADWYLYDDGLWTLYDAYDEDWYDDAEYYGTSYDFADPQDSWYQSEYYTEQQNDHDDDWDDEDDWDTDWDDDDWDDDWDTDDWDFNDTDWDTDW